MTVKLTNQNYSLSRNQKAFRIQKKRNSTDIKDIRVSDIFREDVLNASKNLKESGFKLYVYLLMNQHDYVGGLSMADVTEKTGLSKSSYDRAVKELIEKSYLIYANCFVTDKDGISAPLYDFYSCPPSIQFE